MSKISTGEAVKLRIRAKAKRRQAAKISADDPLMAEAWIAEANELDEQASVRLALTTPPAPGPEHVNGFETHLLTSLTSNWVRWSVV